MAGDALFIEVLPNLAGFTKDLVTGSTKAGSDAGSASGSAWSSAFGKKAGDGGSKGVADELIANEKRAKKAVDDATVNIGKARNAQREAAAKVLLAEQALADAIAKGGEDSAKAQAAALRLEVARDKQETATKGVESAEVALKAAHGEAKTAAKQLADAEADLGKETKSTTERTEEQRAAWDDLKGTLKTGAVATAAAFAAVAAGGVALYKVGETFDDMTDTIRVGTGATGQALDSLVDSAKTVATSVPTDFETASTVVADLNTRLGLTGTTLETVASQVVEAGNMMGKELDISGLTASLNAFRVSGDDTSGALDHLFRVSQATGIGMDELAASVGAQAPAVQALGFSFEETASMIGMLDRAGLNSSAVMASMSKGLVTLAKDGEEPAAAFERVVGEIEGFIASGDQASALKLASKVFGTRGATQFIGALESGSLALDALTESGLMSGDTILGAAADTHDFAETWEMFKNDVLVQIEPVASKVFGIIGDGMAWLRDTGLPVMKELGSQIMDKVGPAFDEFGGFIVDKVVPGFKDAVGWIKENKDWLSAIAVTVGTVAAVWGTYTLATNAWTIATNAAKAAQLAFNVVMNANPIMLIVTAVAALVAGLVYFFTQTETGKEIWASFTDFLGSAWEKVTGWITGAWDAVSAALEAGYQWIDENVFTPVKDGAQWVADKFVAVKDGIVDAWGKVKSGLKAGWDWIYDKVITPYVNLWKWVWDRFVAVKDGLVDAWGKVKAGLKAGWDWIYDKVITPYVNLWNWAKDKFVEVKDGIVGAWGKVKSGLKEGWDWIEDKVFAPLKTGVEAVGTAFDKTREFIATAWGKIKEAAAKPVNFVIETVYTNGIKATWDKIAGAVGLNLKLPTVNPIRFASGGVLPGYTPGRDVHRFYSATAGSLDLSGGEAIMRPEFTRAVGGAAGVARLNAAAIGGRLGGEHQAFAGGGVWSWLKGAGSAVGGFLSNVGNGIANAVVNVGAFLKDPAAGFAALLTKPLEGIASAVGGGTLGRIISAVPRMVVDGIVGRGKDLVDELAGARGPWALPSRGPVTSGFGHRAAPLAGASTYHAGVDIAGGGPTYAAASGRVLKAGWGAVGGRSGIGILLDHGDGIQSYYGHNPVGGVRVAVGDHVKVGEHIGAQGATGNVTGVHLHYEVHKGGTPIDPVPWLKSKGVNLGVYDSGGPLLPGLTLAYNGTGQVETIRTAEQEAALGRLDRADLDYLADRIGEHLGPLGGVARDYMRAVDGARTLERMG